MTDSKLHPSSSQTSQPVQEADDAERGREDSDLPFDFVMDPESQPSFAVKKEMSLLRSEFMQYVRLTITPDIAHDTFTHLGEFGKFHIEDLMESKGLHSQTYLFHKKRILDCVFWENKLEKLEELMQEEQVKIPMVELHPVDAKQGDVISALKEWLLPLETEFYRNYEYKEQGDREIAALEEQQALYLTLQENNVLAVAASDQKLAPSDEKVMLHGDHDGDEPIQLTVLGDSKSRKETKEDTFHKYIYGVIPVSSRTGFERVIWRATRGNAFITFYDIPNKLVDPASQASMEKIAFLIVCIGNHMYNRVKNLCDFLKASRYDVPATPTALRDANITISAQLEEKRLVVAQTSLSLKKVLRQIAFSAEHDTSPLRDWKDAIRKERGISEAIRRCRTTDKTQLISCEGWVPQEDLERLKVTLQNAVKANQSQPALLQVLEAPKSPPTYFKLNKYTKVFQGIVDTYGVPRYREINPGLFTIVTFPFLFGVMYGDIMHGSCLTIFALCLIIFENRLQAQALRGELGEIQTMAFNARYLLFLMGVFALYCGTIYNDFASIPLAVYDTNFEFRGNDTFAYHTGGVYPYGVDPSWHGKKNELAFFNSLKMKLSVTLGVVQMTFGICLSALNNIYFNDWLGVYFEFIPRLVFMLSTFGYMIFIIIYKFCVDWSTSSVNPPNLIQTMIKMFLNIGTVEDDKLLYEGQGAVQGALVLIMVLCIPWMWCIKPCILNHRHKKSLKNGSPSGGSPGNGSSHLLGEEKEAARSADVVHIPDQPKSPTVDERHAVQVESVKSESSSHAGGDGHGHGHGDEPFNFSELFIHQTIHTIEFILGAVSNTASYLRLWALSLAHAELSGVFFDKLILEYGVEGNGFFAFIGLGAWGGATFAVLLSMDVLECFLHALRLHWVEFQSKFYYADGYAFKPFTFVVTKDED